MSRIDELQEQAEYWEGKRHELRAEIERLRTDYSILKSDYDAQRGDIETLQAELRYERRELRDAERLRAQWTETIVQLNNLQNAYDVLMARHAALKAKS